MSIVDENDLFRHDIIDKKLSPIEFNQQLSWQWSNTFEHYSYIKFLKKIVKLII